MVVDIARIIPDTRKEQERSIRPYQIPRNFDHDCSSIPFFLCVMAGINIDLNELRRFRAYLSETRKKMLTHRKELDAEIREARKFWNDEDYAKFVAHVTKLALQMQLFEQAASKHLDYLERKERAGRAALGF